MIIKDDLAAGVAGEHLVCADLILRGYNAFLSDQGLPYDVVADIDGRLLKIQVKTTRGPREVPQRANHTPAYIFHVKRCGKGGKKQYGQQDADLFALVALDSKEVGYISASNMKRTLIPWRGKPASECPDGPRYKAIGNSKTVPVIRWVGQRILDHLAALSNTDAN